MPSIKTLFDQLSNEPSTNGKISLLKSFLPNEELLGALYATYSPRSKYYIKKIPDYTPNQNGTLSLIEAMNKLNTLRNREVTGHEAIQYLRGILEELHADDAHIMERIIARDARVGMNTKNINKVIPNLIETTPYMGAKSYDPKLVNNLFAGGKSCFSQLKIDGKYVNVLLNNGVGEMESRAGNPSILESSTLVKELESIEGKIVLNGELTMSTKPRYEANGIISSLVDIGEKRLAGEDVTKELKKFEKENNMTYYDALDMVELTVWDVIPMEVYHSDKEYDKKYEDRLNELINIVTGINATRIKIIENKEVHSVAEAMDHFKSLLHSGLEGTILKAKDNLWRTGKHNYQIKFKLEMDVDLKIVGFNYGSGKNKDVISSLNVESECGLLKTSPAGLKDKEMRYITDNMNLLEGTVIEVKCCGVSQDNEGNYSLLHPVFKDFRTKEKLTADTLEDILANERMIKNL